MGVAAPAKVEKGAVAPAKVERGGGAECSICHRWFGGIQAMRVHQASKHGPEYHREVRLRTRAIVPRWTDEERRILAGKEAKCIREGVRPVDINSRLYGTVEGKSKEAIKGQRRHPVYRKLVQECIAGAGVVEGEGRAGDKGGVVEERRRPDPEEDGSRRRRPETTINEETLNKIIEVEVEMMGTERDVNRAIAGRFPNVPIGELNRVRKRRWYRRLTCERLYALNRRDFLVNETVRTVDAGAGIDAGADAEEAWRMNILELKEYMMQNWRKALVCGEGELMEILDDATDQERRQMLIDREYMDWVSRRVNNTEPAVGHGRGPKGETREVEEGRTRDVRRRIFGRIQRLFDKDRKRCAEMVLSGEYSENEIRPGREIMSQYWAEVFEGRSCPDQREVTYKNGLKSDLTTFIADMEVQRAIKRLKDAAPGLDGIVKGDLMKVPVRELAVHFNLWMLVGTPPDAFRHGKVVLIPKIQGSLDPGDYRPLAMGAMVGRLFHKVLAERVRQDWPLDERQTAFREGDGLGINITLLRAIIDRHRDRKKQLCLCFIDLSKAFDKVSRESIIKAAKRMGTPENLCQYLERLNGGTTMTVREGGVDSRPMPSNRGVRQGDPLSPLIFNAVMDMVTEELDKAVGVKAVASSSPEGWMAFADDLVLMSETPMGMRILLDGLKRGLAKVGLNINVGKCASLCAGASTRGEKKWVVDDSVAFEVEGKEIRKMNVQDVYKYLGTLVGAGDVKVTTEKKMEKAIANLSRAPLMAAQKMVILKNHLIPRFVHGFTFDSVQQGALRQTDRMVRDVVKKWSKLPRDVPNAFFYAPVKDGGLGIQCLEKWVKILKRRRLAMTVAQAVGRRDETLLNMLFSGEHLYKEQRHVGRLSRLDLTKEPLGALKEAVVVELGQKVDGRGLRNYRGALTSTRWMDPAGGVNAGDYLKMLHIRAAVPYSGARATRGRPGAKRTCTAGCTQLESFNHIVQVCPKTHGNRIRRHNAVVEKLRKRLVAEGWRCAIEPHIKTAQGMTLIPDMCAWREGKAAVFDASIVSDIADLRIEHLGKIQKYDRPEVLEWIRTQATSPPDDIVFSTFICTWRGAVAAESVMTLERLGVPSPLLRLWSEGVMLATHHMWREFRASTWRKGQVTTGEGTKKKE